MPLPGVRLLTSRGFLVRLLYEGFERVLEAQLREGAISQEAYLGTLLTLRRGIGAEKGYVEWCDEAAEMISSATPSRTHS